MGKNLNQKDLARTRISRSLLAVSLAASLAAFGCTTNQNLGNGTPDRSGSELRTAPTSGVTSGQERPIPPPMTSSYTGADAKPRVSSRNASRADRAAAIMAGHQAARGRYLGTVNPAPVSRPYETGLAPAGFVNPALLTNPQLTVNSSISSWPVAGINTGVGGTFVTNGTAVTAPAAATSGFTSSAVVTGVAPTPTTAAAPLPPGALATNRVTPTESVIANSTPTAASSGAVPTTTTLAVTPTVASSGSNLVTSGSAVRLVRPNTGTATITNVGTTSGNNQ